jgi:hypothetical protein
LAAHCCPLVPQQSCVPPPQAVQAPKEQIVLPAWQSTPDGTQTLVELQQALPWQVPFEQHGPFARPHGVQVPLEQPSPVPHALFAQQG